MEYCLLLLLLVVTGDATDEESFGMVLNNACVQYFTPLDDSLLAVTSDVPLTWWQMMELCDKTYPGRWLSRKYKGFTAEEIALCPVGTLVPMGIVNRGDDLRWIAPQESEQTVLTPIERAEVQQLHYLTKAPYWNTYGSVNWPNFNLSMFYNESVFNCAVCQLATRKDAITKGVHPPHNNMDYVYDLELISYHQIDDIKLVANGSDLTNRLLNDLAKAFDISVNHLSWHGAKFNSEKKVVVHVYYDPGDREKNWIYYTHWNDEYLDRKTVSNFEITLIKLNVECVPNQTDSRDLKTSSFVTGAVDYTVDLSRSLVTTRECLWIDDDSAAIWTNHTSWEINFQQCDDIVLLSMKLMTNDPLYKEAMVYFNLHLAKEVQIIVEFYIRPYLDFLSNTLNIFLSLYAFPITSSVFDMLLMSIPDNLAIIYMQTPLQGDDAVTNKIHTKFVNAMLTNLNSSNPVVGIMLSLDPESQENACIIEQINTANFSATPNMTTHMVVTVSESIANFINRLSLVTYAAHLDLPNSTTKYDTSFDGWMALIQVSFTRNETYDNEIENDFVDIAFKPVFHSETMRGKCAERNFDTNRWLGSNCRILKSHRDGMLVCRCKNLRRIGSLTNTVYLVYGVDASLSTYLANHLTLIIVMVFVCIMSALGLLAVLLTFVCFPEWREDQGHKIFIQMMLALAVNLALGFVNSFINIDTKKIGCVIIGVIKHYSFLAMFFWMMILSGLQLKRILTISGSKSTTHLILKVSLLAWGLPLIPIVVLLAWDTSFYKSDIANRGYCYPEGLAFQTTVQTPVGVILMGNLFIFILILNHVYGWVKCNKDVVVRKHTTNDRAQMIRKLANSIFIFFLFGFTWLFHFLSEEGLINSEFLFEFMFLITASFHVFMLSLFFIVLDKNTRTLWMHALGKKDIRRGSSMALTMRR